MNATTQQLIDTCLEAVKNGGSSADIRTIVAATIARPQAMLDELGQPEQAGVNKLYVAENLTVLNVVWAPRMTLRPHNHNMWAVIGVYTGREDNIFWRRSESGSKGRIEAAGARSLGPGEAYPLGRNIIHSVTNPTADFTAAIHVYGGNFFTKERSEWDPLSLQEQPYNLSDNMRLFEESNAMWTHATD